MDNSIYCKSFAFQTSSFEVYQDGICLKRGSCDTRILAEPMNSECIAMMFQGNIPVKVNRRFGLPIFGAFFGDVLEDRIQYGRLPDNMSWRDPNEPIVCNIFNNGTCIRFAMLSPLRIVDFYGEFTVIM